MKGSSDIYVPSHRTSGRPALAHRGLPGRQPHRGSEADRLLYLDAGKRPLGSDRNLNEIPIYRPALRCIFRLLC